MKISITFCLCFFLLIGCKNQSKDTSIVKNQVNVIDKAQDYLFTIPNNTGIHFKNMIIENANLNGILYEYLYNGGGVAVSDFNGDNLKDIYFVSNLESNQLYINKGKLNFQDVTNVSNVNDEKGFSTGVTVVDINADGKMDIYVCKSGKFSNPNDRRNQLFINKGNNEEGIPIFEEEGKLYKLDLPHFSTQSAFFDYDKDGDLDMFLINHGTKPYEDYLIENLLNTPNQYQSSRLFRNDNGKFVDVSEQSGIVNNALSFGLGISIGDLNNDNWPDVLVGHDFSEKDHIYLNQKNGTFKDVVSKATNHISYFSMGNDISDFNNDGWMDFCTVDMMSEHNYDIKTSMSGMNPEGFYKLTDLGLHHQYMYNAVQVNNGLIDDSETPVFSDIAQMAGMSSTDWSWAPLFFDMDNDGWKDVFVSNGIKRDFRNNDYVKYKEKVYNDFFKKYPENTAENKQRTRGLIMELINKMPKRNKPNYFFKNQNGILFKKKNNSWVNDISTSSNGAAYADLDNDGDVDIVVNNTDDVAFIYENKSTLDNNYLNIKLKGTEKNPNAIGARVIIKHNNKTQVQENYFTRGFQSASSDNLHFGIGSNEKIDEVKVIWPDNKITTLANVKSNQTLPIDYNLAQDVEQLHENTQQYLFADVTAKSKIAYQHQENEFDDFERESLLPHRMSQIGPALAKADLNGDGLDDFYIGGASGFTGKLFYQLPNGQFKEEKNTPFKKHEQFEDVNALFFDADNDNDLDLYVVSGGNEFDQGSNYLKDRFYENTGSGNFKINSSLPNTAISGSKVIAADYDKDGDLDLFVGGRQKPGHYPEPVNSTLLQNNSTSGRISFIDVTQETASALLDIGMVTDAIWIDIDNDEWLDLMIVGEWMSPIVLKNVNGNFRDISESSGLSEETGWWFSISSGDFDGDGDQDLIAGNLGLNYKYKASKDEPFEVYQNDFDNNGTLDIVLGYYDLGTLYPLRGRECSSNQMPIIKEKFKNYDAFGQASLVDVYGASDLEKSIYYKATNFATSYFENMGDGTFKVRSLNDVVQISSVNAININDFDGDGFLDAVLSGNWYVSEVETPRNDASFGIFLKGLGDGNFKAVPASESGLYIKGDVRNTELLNSTRGEKALLIAKNNDFIQLYNIKTKVNKNKKDVY